MGNICTTLVTFYGEDTGKLYHNIEEWLPKDEASNFKYDGWLGNIVKGAGIDIESLDCDCRGDIECYNYYPEYEQLDITQSDQWYPMVRLWPKVIEKMGYDLDIVYLAEEPANDLYWTNDTAAEGEDAIGEGTPYKLVEIDEIPKRR